MIKKAHPSLLALILIISLGIGITGNMTSKTATVIIAAVILLVSFSQLLARQVNRLSRPWLRAIVGGILLAMVIGQIYVLTAMPDTIYHDPYRILSQADQLAAGHLTWDTTYFWRYPNNVTLAYFLSLWLRLTNLLALSSNVAIHILSLSILDTFIVLTLKTVWQVNKRNSALLGSLAFLALTPFAYTYYLQIFYSDLLSMLVLLIIIRTLLFWNAEKSSPKSIKGTILVLTTTFGMLIKPNIIVIVPSLCLLLVVLWRKKLLKQTKLLLPLVLIVVGVGLAKPVTLAINQASHFTNHPGYEFPASHWILMGTNEKYEGMYADNDVAKDIALPTVQARKNYDDRQILNRLGQLGPLGLIHLWTEKLSILLDTSQIQDWYNGGFQSAPAWYQKRSYLFQKLTLITYAAATITLWLLLISRLVKWRPDLRQHQEVITFLAVMIALAYLAFHTILWETEPRYGQIILPLLLFITNALPQGQAVTEKKVHLRIYRRFWLQASLVGSSAAIFLIFSQHIQLDDNVVAAQQSQLSTQYKAKPTAIAPGTTLSEKIKLNKSADYIDVQVHANSTVTANLVDNQGNEVSRLTYSDGDYTSKEKIQPGSYRLVLTNQSSQNQLVDVVQTYNYQLSPYPLAINGTEYKDASLIFNVLLTEKR